MAKTSSAENRKQGKIASTETTALAKELGTLIPQLDAEGLEFLIEQARVHLYNMEVSELERAASQAGSKQTSKNATLTPAAANDDFAIQASSDGSTYDLVYNGKWKMFTGDEILAMVRIVSSKDPVNQVAGRLYRWFLAERSDVKNDLPLAGPSDPKLKKLVSLLCKTFTIKRTQSGGN